MAQIWKPNFYLSPQLPQTQTRPVGQIQRTYLLWSSVWRWGPIPLSNLESFHKDGWKHSNHTDQWNWLIGVANFPAIDLGNSTEKIGDTDVWQRRDLTNQSGIKCLSRGKILSLGVRKKIWTNDIENHMVFVFKWGWKLPKQLICD